MSQYATPQEEFWAGNFGADYIGRNQGDVVLAANLQFFTKALSRAGWVDSCVELGANIGMNLKALKLLYPGLNAHAVEINAEAAKHVADVVGADNVSNQSIYDWKPTKTRQLSFIKGVLIHLAPEMLPTAYDRLYAASEKYVLVAEYYNPTPVMVSYRGHADRLFKRDFAGEMLDRFSDLRLVDYGCTYRRDPQIPSGEADDFTWFLMQKSGT